MSEYYFYGLAALMYLTTCWMFAAVRWFHTCRAPKERHRYIWPDRQLQCVAFLCPTVLLPYVINPMSQAAWTLVRNYYPATYYFYCATLLLCFFGSVKQWNRWKSISWLATIMVCVAVLPLVVNAVLPAPILSADGLTVWQYVVGVESAVMVVYVGMALWQVKHWLDEIRDANYSNPADFPADYAHRMLLVPLLLTPLIWPAYLMDSPATMAVQHVLLAVSNVVLLINVMPVWRRKVIVANAETDDITRPQTDEHIEELIEQTALEIRAYVEQQYAYLDSHLKMDDVVGHTSLGRTYVSLTFQRRFGSFAAYVNCLRLKHYEQYASDHANETKEAAAQASGFSNYMAYYRAKQKYQPVG